MKLYRLILCTILSISVVTISNAQEKKAIKDIEEMIELFEDDCLLTTEDDIKYLKVILNLIKKQQKEIEELNKENTRQ